MSSSAPFLFLCHHTFCCIGALTGSTWYVGPSYIPTMNELCLVTHNVAWHGDSSGYVIKFFSNTAESG